jgi:glycosyltransferase involved in cell wall biosynthesis
MSSAEAPVRVLHVTKDLPRHGGTPRSFLFLVRETDREQVRHDFLVFDDCTDSLAGDLAAMGSTVISVRRKTNWDLRLVSDVARVAGRLESDVISTHFARADIYGCMAAVLTGRPVIKEAHGILWNDSPAVAFVDGLLARRRFAFVGGSQAIVDAFRARGPVRNPIVVLNGVEDLSHRVEPGDRARVRHELGIPADAFVFGHIGALIPIRDQDVLIRAVALLCKRGHPAYCVIVGDGPLAEELAALVERLDVSDHVRLLGGRSDVPALLAAMDVYVNMCRAEGFGIAVVEAMQCSIPPILARAGAHPELAEDGVSAVFVPVGEVGPLVEALDRLRNDESVRRRIGEAARSVAHTRFTMSRYAEEMNAVYRAAAATAKRN